MKGIAIGLACSASWQTLFLPWCRLKPSVELPHIRCQDIDTGGGAAGAHETAGKAVRLRRMRTGQRVRGVRAVLL